MLEFLLQPFSFYLTRGPNLKIFLFIGPGLLAALVVVLLGVLFPSANVFDENGIIDRLVSLIQILPGFFIAALSAVSTFQGGEKSNLDREVDGGVQMRFVDASNTLHWLPPTRRYLLCSLLSFLSALSLLLAIFGSILVPLYDVIWPCVESFWGQTARSIVLFIFSVLMLQLLNGTLLVLYYIGHKMHKSY